MRNKLLMIAVVVAGLSGEAIGQPATTRSMGVPPMDARADVAPTSRPGVVWTPMPLRSAYQAKIGMAGGEGGQCVYGITRCAADDSRIYLGVDVVGVWRSTDGGATWRPCRQEGLRCLGTSSIAVHPLRPDEVLVYSESPEWDKPRKAEEGLYRSTDGGEHWTRVLAVSNNDPRRHYRHLIDYAASDGLRVYFASYGEGIYRSDDGGRNWSPPLALKKTVISEVRVDPRDRDMVWAATDEGLFLSHNAGQDFARIEALGDATITAVSPDPAMAGRVYIIKEGAGLHRSDDGGKTFAAMPTGDADLDAKAKGIFQSPCDPRRILVASFDKMRLTHDGGKTWRAPRIDWSKSYVQAGGWAFCEGFTWSHRKSDEIVGALSCGMYASIDGGLTFSDSMTGYNGFHHGWANAAVAFSATDANRFAFFCYDYAFNITTDGGRTFRDCRLKEKVRDWWGMYVGDMHPRWEETPVVIAAAGNYGKNQLVRSADGGATWAKVPDTDGAYFFVRFHPASPRFVYADQLRSDDGGVTFRKLAQPIHAYAPSRPDTVYGYTGGKVWRSDDRGDHWNVLPDPPAPAGPFDNRLDLRVDPKNPDRVWAMTPPDAARFDGKAWRKVEASRWAPAEAHAYVNRFAIDPGNPQRVILGLDAIGSGYLFLSDDGGETWCDITGNLPRLGPAQSLNIQPATGRIFIGAGFGTWTATVKK